MHKVAAEVALDSQHMRTAIAMAMGEHEKAVGGVRDTPTLEVFDTLDILAMEQIAVEFAETEASWNSQGIDSAPTARDTFTLNLLTEDNLFAYDRIINSVPGHEMLTRWNRRWTAEEHSHGLRMLAVVMAVNLTNRKSDLFDTKKIDRLMPANIMSGIHLEHQPDKDRKELIIPENISELVAYTSVQEILTNKPHARTGQLFGTKVAEIMEEIAGDESRHAAFFRRVFRAVVEQHPDLALTSFKKMNENFAMPGSEGIKGYALMAWRIAVSGLFTVDTVLDAQEQVARHTKLLEAEPKTDEGKTALEWASSMSEQKAVIETRQKLEEGRDRAKKKADRTGGLAPIIAGRTVNWEDNTMVPIANAA